VGNGGRAGVSDPRALPFDVVIAASHLRYDGVWQRPQQLLSRVARHVPVLFIEEPFASGDDGERIISHGALDVLRPLRRLPHDAPIDAATIESARRWAAGRRVLVWMYTPMMRALVEAFADATIVYDCMDELAAFDFAPPEMKARDLELAARADLIFAGGRSLYLAREQFGQKVRLYPSAVEFEHFAAASRMAPHPMLRALAPPIYGYFGAIDERIDRDVVAALAGDANVVMIGPIVKVSPSAFARSPRLHFTGQVDYALLPSFLAGFDVAIMPFARNASTANISPTKTPEYLASGKPVVSTTVADVTARYGDVVSFADGPDNFVAAARTVLDNPDPAKRARGVALARQSGWDATVEAMLADAAKAAASVSAG
jgi:glycosyltransferase involved in cell wall biosynthesis